MWKSGEHLTMNFKRRWVVLQPPSLQWFKEKQDSIPSGTCDLSEVATVKLHKKLARPNCIKICLRSGVKMYFSAENEEEARKWLVVFLKHLQLTPRSKHRKSRAPSFAEVGTTTNFRDDSEAIRKLHFHAQQNSSVDSNIPGQSYTSCSPSDTEVAEGARAAVRLKRSGSQPRPILFKRNNQSPYNLQEHQQHQSPLTRYHMSKASFVSGKILRKRGGGSGDSGDSDDESDGEGIADQFGTSVRIDDSIQDPRTPPTPAMLAQGTPDSVLANKSERAEAAAVAVAVAETMKHVKSFENLDQLNSWGESQMLGYMDQSMDTSQQHATAQSQSQSQSQSRTRTRTQPRRSGRSSADLEGAQTPEFV
jgi:hypothetical protein